MPNLSPADRQRMRDAITALPEPTRSVYVAHLVEGLDYQLIGQRAGLSLREVERHIAEAIMLIDRHLCESGERSE